MPKRLQIGAREVSVSSLDKVLFGASGYTKAELIDYYARVGDYALPHLRDRALMMHRFPAGIGKQGFYQKDAGSYFPDWIERARLKKEGGTVDHVVCNEAATLVYLANQNCIALHSWLSRVDRPQHPDQMIFDLDPSDNDFALVRRVARQLRDLLEGELGLATFVKTTGSRGLHVLVPLDRKVNFDAVRDFARDAATVIAARLPAQVTVEVRKQKRRGRLFLDVARNAYAQTAVAPYSVRAREGAPVATPLEWSEVGSSALRPDKYNIKNLLRRLSRKADPWADVARHAQGLGKARKRLDALRAGAEKQ